MRDPKLMAVVRFEAHLANGEVLAREWTMAEAPSATLNVVPDWGQNPRKTWPHPQDPVTLKVDVIPGREDEARAALEAAA